MTRHERLSRLTDDELYRRLGEAFLDVCFEEEADDWGKAHLTFSRYALELQRRQDLNKRRRWSDGEPHYCHDCRQYHP